MTRHARLVCSALLAACGSSSAPAKPPPVVAVVPVRPVRPVSDERAHHDEIAAAHRKIEEEQQDALAATCTESPPGTGHERCLPSCYPTEAPDPRAGKKLAGATELPHLACEAAPGSGAGPFVIADELEPAKLAVRPVRGRFPAPHKKGTWQATVEAALTDAERPKLPRGDVIVVSGSWRELVHPLTKERLHCVVVARYTKSIHHALDGCGAAGALACEATGNAAARGINVVHYRLAEARRLQGSGKTTECQQAALEAIAVARGLPRWRQYTKLNVAKWVDHPGYRSRFDGILDEDALFATAASLGTDAEAIYTACGGTAPAMTIATQEQSFHTCW